MSPQSDDAFFETLAEQTAPEDVRAPSRVKSRTYSRLMLQEAGTGPLSSVSETKRRGRPLCVFEELVRIAPAGDSLKERNFCRICHARLLAESIENAPIFWRHCPYVSFQNR